MDKEFLDKRTHDQRLKAKLPVNCQSVGNIRPTVQSMEQSILTGRRVKLFHIDNPKPFVRSLPTPTFRQHSKTWTKLRTPRSSSQISLLWKVLIGISFITAVSSSAFSYYRLKGHQSTAVQIPRQLTQQRPITSPTQETSSQKSAQPSIISVTTPTQVATKVSEPVYLPSGLPGYNINNDIQVLSNKTVNYTITDSKGATYFVVQQLILPTFNLNDFSKNLTDVEKVSTPAGSAIIGNNHSELIASVRTPQNLWVLISATNINLKPQLVAIVKSLKAASQ